MHRQIVWPIVGILTMFAGPLSQAQKLADAPSTVMLARNIQQQNDGTTATGGIPMVSTVASDKNMRAASQQPRVGTRVDSIPAQLTIQQAEQIAIQNNPRISVSRLFARAQHQVYRETRSAYLPQLDGGAVAAEADSGSRYTYSTRALMFSMEARVCSSCISLSSTIELSPSL